MATANPYTSTQAPMAMQMIAPDIAQEQMQLARRQQMVDLLRKQSLEPMGGTETVGGWAIKKSPLEGLGKVAQALVASHQQKAVDTKNLELAKALQGRMGDILGGGGQPGQPAPQMENRTDETAMGPQSPVSAPQAQSAPATSDNFTMAKLLRGQVIGDLGGQGASAAYWDGMKPTEANKRDRELGYTTPESRATEDAKRVKEGYIAPTRLGEGAYNDPKLGIQGLPTTAPSGFINVRGPEGWSTQAVKGGTDAVTQSTAAKELGSAQLKPSVVYGANGAPRFSTVAKDIERASGTLPAPQPATSNFTGAPEAVIADIMSIPNPQDRSNALAAYQAQARSTPNFATSGGVTPQLAPGFDANAKVSQEASAQTMKDSYAKLQAANSTSQAAIDAIQKMQAIAEKKNSALTAGYLGTHQDSINPDAAEYGKQRANLIAQLAQQNGTNGTDAGRALTGESVPDFGKPKPAIADGLGNLKNQTIAQQIKTGFLTTHFQSGDSKKYTELEYQFDKNIAPSMVPMLTAQPGPDRAKQLQEAAKNPAMRAKLEWAAQNGLLK